MRSRAIPFAMAPATTPVSLADADLPRPAPILPAMTRMEWASMFAIGWLLETTGVSALTAQPILDVVPLSTAQIVLLLTLDLLAWAPLLVACFWVFDRTPLVPGRVLAHGALRGVALAVASLLQLELSTLLCTPVLPLLNVRQADLDRVWSDAPAANLPFIALGAVAVTVAYFVIQRIHLTRRSLARAAELQAAAASARLSALTAELRPHFLFNALNGIAELVHQDAARAEGMLLRLGALLRGTLEGSSAVVVPLAQELVQLDHYLGLQQMRFGDRLEVGRRVAAGAETALVPPMLLQPIVENALVHGIERIEGPGRLFLEAAVEPDTLVVTVRDNGPGPQASHQGGTGTGLRNTRERLQTLYGDAASVTLAPDAVRGTVVTIRLPLRHGAGA